jgi:hypothetical protein
LTEPPNYPPALRCPGCPLVWPVPDWSDSAAAAVSIAALRNHLEATGHLARLGHVTVDQIVEAIKAATVEQ